jgi:hypothetical protein
MDLPCARRLSHTGSILSTKREPATLAEPKEPLHHSTALRGARSAMVFVGSTRATCGGVQNAAPRSCGPSRCRGPGPRDPAVPDTLPLRTDHRHGPPLALADARRRAPVGRSAASRDQFSRTP